MDDSITDTHLPHLLAAMQPVDGGWLATIPDTWLQGRTCYGGLSTAIAHHAAQLLVPDAPPLRSAQVGFVGPIAAGPVTVTGELLRRGKNSAYIETRIIAHEGGAPTVGHTGQFIFMAPRESKVLIDCPVPDDIPPIPQGDEIQSTESRWFTRNMEYSDKRVQFGEGKRRFRGWHRLKQRDGLDVMTELLCLADALPPAAMAHTMSEKPISSMNWQVNLLDTVPATRDGWWFLESEVHHSHHGASSQYMSVYNADLHPVMKGMQAIAVFG